MPILESILLGVVSSLISSFIFLYILLIQLRPKIAISKFISLDKDLDNPQNRLYYFKFINKSNFAAFDIHLRICELIRIPAGDGKMHEQRKDLQLRKSNLSHVPRYRKVKNGRTFAPHAIVVTCLDDLSGILENPNKCVELQVIMRHGLTGLSKVFHFEYGDNTAVKNGHFAFGNELTVLQ